jgi:hypothetical protein
VVVTDASPFAANEKNLSVTNTFAVEVREVNVAPQLTVPANLTVDELVSMNASAFATDADFPTNSLVFDLISAPPGMQISPGTGVIRWVPTEEEGPGVYTVSVVVSDALIQQPANWATLRTTNSFTITVREVNVAPVVTVPESRSVNELEAVTLQAGATDLDAPTNTLTFSLLTAPEGMTIAQTGVISWTPSETQGGTTNIVRVVVADNNPGATTGTSLRTTNSFTLTVREVNSAPIVTSITNQAVRFGFLWTNQVNAVDNDLPANQLTYSVEEGPSGLTINPTTGALSWTPLEAQVGTHTVRVRVTDDGTPAQNGETTFQIVVTGEETRLEIIRVGTLVQVTILGNVGLNYRLERSEDLTNWVQQSEFRLTTSPQQYVDPDSIQTRTNRNYRLRTLE